VEYAVTQVFYVTDKNVSIAGNMTEALPFSQLFTCTTVAFKKNLQQFCCPAPILSE